MVPRSSTASRTSLYHATHRDPYDTGDVVAMLTSLSVSVLAAILLLTPAPDPDPAAAT